MSVRVLLHNVAQLHFNWFEVHIIITFSHETLQVKEETKPAPKSLKESVSAVKTPLLLTDRKQILLVGVSLEETCL